MPDLVESNYDSLLEQKKKDVQKGKHILNQRVLFEQLLNVRIQLQNALKLSNELPKSLSSVERRDAGLGLLQSSLKSEAANLLSLATDFQTDLLTQNSTISSIWVSKGSKDTSENSQHSQSEDDSCTSESSQYDDSDDSIDSDLEGENLDRESDKAVDSGAEDDVDGVESSEIDSDEASISGSAPEKLGVELSANASSCAKSKGRSLADEGKGACSILENDSNSDSNKNKESGASLEESLKMLEEGWNGYANFRDGTLEKWSEKVNAAKLKGALSQKKLNVLNNSALANFKLALSDRDRLRRKSQLMRVDYSFIDEPSASVNSAGAKENDYCSEIYDDMDFYQVLLRDLLESQLATNDDPIALSQKWANFRSLQKQAQRKKLTNKVGQLIDRKASKGRKLRYHVHDKLEGFMSSQPMPVPEALECLNRTAEKLSTLKLQKSSKAVKEQTRDFEFTPDEFD